MSDQLAEIKQGIEAALAREEQRRHGGYRLPAGDERITFIGRTGTGKTTAAAGVLSHANFTARPWVIIDTKGEVLFDRAGERTVRELPLGTMPPYDAGLWRVYATPWDNKRLENYLEMVWERENIGLFIDEAMNMPPRSEAFSAILRQGRSKRIPVIACSQRPFKCGREVFSEADLFVVFALTHPEDRHVVSGFCPVPWERRLPRRYSWWYDVPDHNMQLLKPFEHPDTVLRRLRERATPTTSFFGGLRWAAR